MKIIACLKTAAALFLLAAGVFVFINTAQAAGDSLMFSKPNDGSTVRGTSVLFSAEAKVEGIDWVSLYYQNGASWEKMNDCLKKWFVYHKCWVDTTKYPDGNYVLKVISSNGDYKSPELRVAFANGQGMLAISGTTTRTINNQVVVSGKEANKVFNTVDLKFIQVVNYPNKPLVYNYFCQKQGGSSVWNCVVDTANMLDGVYDVYMVSGTISSKKVVMTVKNGNTQCKPKTCKSMSFNCGEVSDGCGATLKCGTCNTGYACKNNKCQKDNRSASFVKYNPKTINWVSGTDDFRIYAKNMGANDKVSLAVIYNSPYNKSARISKTVIERCTATNTSNSNYDCVYNTKELPNGEATFYILLDGVMVKNSGVKIMISNSTCAAKTCNSAKISCGVISDGCGGTLDCRTCPAGYDCTNEICQRQTTTTTTTNTRSLMLVYPVANAWVTGISTFKVYPTGLSGTDRVNLYRAFTKFGITFTALAHENCELDNSAYYCELDTTKYGNGEYQFYATTSDGKVVSEKVIVNIQNSK